MKHLLTKMTPSFAYIKALVLALVVTGATSLGAAQVGTSETVIQKATEQFESTPPENYLPGPRLICVFWGRRRCYGHRR
jgi:hypothetical protein